MTNRTRLVSGRVVTSNSANVTSDRYQYLDLSSAEPNLGTANVGDVLTYDTAYPGARRWITQSYPIVLNDISTQLDSAKCVFNLKVDQSNVTSIMDSKNLEVVINGARLSPYVKELRYPWITPYDSFKGYRVSTQNTASNTAQTITIYNAPAYGEQAVLTIINSSSSPQTKKYPYSAATIALGD